VEIVLIVPALELSRPTGYATWFVEL